MKKGDLNKCKLFYMLGSIMAVLGLILLIVSTAVKFSSYDAFAYIGGIILLLGLSLIFLW